MVSDKKEAKYPEWQRSCARDRVDALTEWQELEGRFWCHAAMMRLLTLSPSDRPTHTMVAGLITWAAFWGRTDGRAAVNQMIDEPDHTCPPCTHSWNVVAAETLLVGFLGQRLLEVGGDAATVGAGGAGETARGGAWTPCGWRERRPAVRQKTHTALTWWCHYDVTQPVRVGTLKACRRTHGGLAAGLVLLLIFLNTGNDEGAFGSRRGGKHLAAGRRDS